jgi:general transcription factor 3C polypeptide 2
MSFEDGTMKTVSLLGAASDLPVTGTIYTGKKQPWLHGSTYSSYAIWSVQVSRITGAFFLCTTVVLSQRILLLLGKKKTGFRKTCVS